MNLDRIDLFKIMQSLCRFLIILFTPPLQQNLYFFLKIVAQRVGNGKDKEGEV
jgi:hypothetical protein